MSRTIKIGSATVVYTDYGCYSAYPDGTGYAAQPHDTSHYHVIAHRCGYGDDILAYCREHEVCHHIIGEWVKGTGSEVIRPLADGAEPDQITAVFEEVMVQTLQRWLRTNERPIIGNLDWDDLKHRALAVLDVELKEAA